jgi:hypothetical protein
MQKYKCRSLNKGNKGNHLFFLVAVFFCAFWAALSWAFCWAALSLLTVVFFYPCFLAMAAFFLSLIYLMAYSAKAFLSYGLAVFIFLIASRVTPSIALSILRAFCLFSFPASDCLIFLCSLLQAVVHLSLWALSLLWLYYDLPETEISSSLRKIQEWSAVFCNVSNTFSWVYFIFAEWAQFCLYNHNI